MSWSIGDDGVARSALIDAVPGIAHGFSATPVDYGGVEAPNEAVVAARARFVEACGLAPGQPLLLRQVHGDRIVEDRADAESEADGWFLGRRVTGAVAIRVADCVPVLLASRDGRALAALHSGWRGTAAGIVPRAVARFGAEGHAAAELVAALGPAISGAAYEVGDEVLQAMGPGPWIEGRHVDLRRRITAQLVDAGLAEAAVSAAPWCTFGESSRFFSYRRQRAAAGRMLACIGWSP